MLKKVKTLALHNNSEWLPISFTALAVVGYLGTNVVAIVYIIKEKWSSIINLIHQ